jgi:hypothetical protein
VLSSGRGAAAEVPIAAGLKEASGCCRFIGTRFSPSPRAGPFRMSARACAASLSILLERKLIASYPSSTYFFKRGACRPWARSSSSMVTKSFKRLEDVTSESTIASFSVRCQIRSLRWGCRSPRIYVEALYELCLSRNKLRAMLEALYVTKI